MSRGATLNSENHDSLRFLDLHSNNSCRSVAHLSALSDADKVYLCIEAQTPGLFFVNIRFMFNGDRLAFVKGYRLKKEQPTLPGLDLEQVPALAAPGTL